MCVCIIQSEWVFFKEGGTYYGVYAQINIQNPKLEDPGQFSEAVMRIENGQGDRLNIIQTGWMVIVFSQCHSFCATINLSLNLIFVLILKVYQGLYHESHSFGYIMDSKL